MTLSKWRVAKLNSCAIAELATIFTGSAINVPADTKYKPFTSRDA